MEEGLEDESLLAGRSAWRSRSRNLTLVALEEGPAGVFRSHHQLILVSGHQAFTFTV